MCTVLLAVSRARGIEVPGSGGRLSVGGYLDGLAVVDTGGGPRQRPEAVLDLGLDATATSWLRGRLDLRTRLGGPFEGGHPGAYNFVHEFQNYSPAVELNEAYADLRGGQADLRVGVQKVAWGKLDGVPPTDVVNPRDYHDPLVEDVEERKIGIPAVLGTYYAPDLARLDLSGLRATLVYVPIAVPPRLALAEERWFPSSITPASRLTLPASLLATTSALTRIVVPIEFQTMSHRPPKGLDAGGIALRVGGSWREMDWDLYHYTGPETGPDADLRSIILHPHTRGSTLRIPSVATLRQAHDTIHMTGGDWAAAVAGVTVRAEVAVFQDRPYLRPASDLTTPAALAALPLRQLVARATRRGQAAVPLGPLFVESDSVEWGIGADTVIDGFVPLVQLNQVIFLDSVPRLLIADPETRLTGSLRKSLLADRLELEVRGICALERGSWFVLPRATYRLRDDLRLRLGYLAIGGPRESLIGQFHDNDEVVFEARYSF